MTPEYKKALQDHYISCTYAWGITLAYAITRSPEEAERVVADAIVSIIAHELAMPTKSLSHEDKSIRYATMVWEVAKKKAYNGQTQDSFFRMSPPARAIVVLKLKARLSPIQIAKILSLNSTRVIDILDNARINYSSGRPWIGSAGHLDRVVSHSPIKNYRAGKDVSEVLTRYMAGDLDQQTSSFLNSHFRDCNDCRGSFSNFKNQFISWNKSIPTFHPNPNFEKDLRKLSQQAFSIDRHEVRFMPGFTKALKKIDFRVVGLFAVLIYFLQKLIGLSS